VRRARDGDVEAYGALLRAHQGAARRVAAVVVGTGDADEVAQDAFVKAWAGLGTFRPAAPFRPWLLRIVVNEARNRRRAAGRRAGYELRFAVDPTTASPAGSPEAAVVAADVLATLQLAVARLPARQREVVACRYLVGLSEDETAAALGLARGTVKSRASRGLARLRRLLDQVGEGGGDD
jgi:RNA polymerase sigma factor (sigma-70 family)